MSIESMIARGRVKVLEHLRDTCTIFERGERGAFNQTTGRHEDPTETTIYAGACQVRPSVRTEGHEEQVGELREVLGSYMLKVPYSVTGATVGHLVRIDSSDDPRLVGRTMTVTTVLNKTGATERRLILEEPQVREG